MSGQIPRRALIANITNSVQCEIETLEDHGYVDGDFVRITDLGDVMPIKRHFTQLDDNLYRVVFVDDTHFKIKDILTDEFIDSTDFGMYVEGGRVNLDNHNYVYTGE